MIHPLSKDTRVHAFRGRNLFDRRDQFHEHLCAAKVYGIAQEFAPVLPLCHEARLFFLTP